MKLSLQIPFTLMLLLMVMLTGCSANENHYTKEDVLQTFEEQGLRLSRSDTPPITYNKVQSNAYLFEQEWIYIFEYKNDEERTKGVLEYQEMINKITGWLPVRTYVLGNLFMLHLKEETDLDKEIGGVIAALSSTE